MGEIAAADSAPRSVGALRSGATIRRASTKAGQNGEPERRSKQRAGAQDRGVDGCIGFRDRQFDKYQPAQRRDQPHARQGPARPVCLRRVPERTAAWSDAASAARTWARCERSELLKHQTDVRMSDQPTLLVDDIDLPALANLDLRDDIPDEREIDLGNAHACVAPRAGERDRHIGLGLVTKIDWAVIDLARHGSMKAALFERSIWLPITSIARRDTLSCSRPDASSSVSSVIAGTWRSSRSASRRRCSYVPAATPAAWSSPSGPRSP